MEKTTLIRLLVLVLSIMGIVFLCIGIGLVTRERKKKNMCTKPVTAVVVDIQKESVGAGDFAASGEARLKSWFPVYEYTVDGVKHRAKAFVGTAKPEVKVGQTVELLVNPNCADDFYSPAEKMSCIQKVFVGVGAVCLCLAVIMLAIVYTCA